MKKLNYFLTVVAGGMMLASCSNDKEVVVSVNDNAVQQIVLQVASNGDGLTTRAGRPLLSNEAAQKIDVVDIYIVSDDPTDATPLKYSTNVDWSKSTNYDNGKMMTLSLKASDKLEKGKYTIYALGHTETSSSDYVIPEFTNDNIGSIKDYVLTYKEDKSTPEEIFAGSLNFEVTESRDFSKTIILNRQVAGAYFYVYNLPMIDGLTKDSELRLVASDINDQLVLGNFANTDISGNGDNSGTNVKYVVNGKKSGKTSGDKIICKAKIGDWYKDIVDKNNDGLVDISYIDEENGDATINNWISTKEADGRQGKKYVKGSIFAGNFIMPFKSDGETQTLQLVLVNGTTPLTTWNVNLQKDSDAPTSLSYYNENKWNLGEAVTETKHFYSIVRNHLYGVGVRTSDGVPNPKDPNDPDNPDDPDDPTDPDDPDEPDDPNMPEDLSKGQNLTLIVNHNWEVIYKMELE